MNSVDWLHPVRQALSNSSAPLTVFFRDDDAGWADQHLMNLLDLFARHGAPIDLAVIPDATQPHLSAELLRRQHAAPHRLGLHQHGFCHQNHQSEGRKCEFGPARTRAQQQADIARGQTLLAEHFADRIDRIFTPPWNRCTQDTADGLVELGFKVLSRTRGATPLDLGNLAELGVGFDWCRDGPVDAAARATLGQRLADAIGAPGPLGIMLHHAVMGDGDATALGELLELLTGHAQVNLALMRDIAGLEWH